MDNGEPEENEGDPADRSTLLCRTIGNALPTIVTRPMAEQVDGIVSFVLQFIEARDNTLAPW